jgi:hypothetical protein
LKKGELIDNYEDIIQEELNRDEQVVDEEIRKMQLQEIIQLSLQKEELKLQAL